MVRETEAPDSPGDARPPQLRMGLLDYITTTSMDEDYAHVSTSRAESSAESRPSKNPGLAALVIMGLFGLLVATAAVQTSRSADSDATGNESLVQRIETRTTQVEARRARAEELRAEVQSLQNVFLEATSQGRALSSRLDRLSLLAGAVPVTGPGVEVVVDDNPNAVSEAQQVLDEDLQRLANALWESGAEAVAINNQRLTSLSAIRLAGDAITVNNVSLSRPYTVQAIGDPDTMMARFIETTHGAGWYDLRAIQGLEFDMEARGSMRLPAADRLDLRNARKGNR